MLLFALAIQGNARSILMMIIAVIPELLIVVIVVGVLGARGLYVLTNLSAFMGAPLEALRIDRGGLSFHGGLLGGLLGAWLVTRRSGMNLRVLMDLAVPGLAIGYMLVRIANIFNQEILGRPAELFFFEQHPTQIYGSLIGLVSLLIHNYLARNLPAFRYHRAATLTVALADTRALRESTLTLTTFGASV